jgi:hypothetical protein
MRADFSKIHAEVTLPNAPAGARVLSVYFMRFIDRLV